ncbi:hypothetical protein PORY_002097 [Pneumocystis oryctolagi]|uniref:Uncharacterized protein n=1 Tax=Pneumocystis oryctolagi TaxID=42067 RepID=A0ACB7CBF6_9ASCO|nr:hypothetical protein PORY_002097 [Pneumocystis oryctolagi]
MNNTKNNKIAKNHIKEWDKENNKNKQVFFQKNINDRNKNENQHELQHKEQIIFSNKLENKKNIFFKDNIKSLNHMKKISLTHLFNFSYPQSTYNSQLSMHSNYRNTKKRKKSEHNYHSKGKEHFINSNYRFIVNPYENYRLQMLDPDVPIPWKNIFQILISRLMQHTTCSICLEEDSIAPRMTKCGHIFCLHCIISYFESKNKESDKHIKYIKCPICFDTVYIADLKPIRWYDNISPELPIEGKEIRLHLFIRKHGYFSAFPCENVSKSMDEEDIPWYFEPDVLDYSRIMKASENYMIKEMNDEIKQLQRIKEDKKTDIELIDGSIDKTIYYIQQSILSFEKISNDYENFHTERTSIEPETNTEKSLQKMFKELHLQDDVLEASTESSHNNIQKNNSYLFYRPQIITHYYLSILDIKILKTAFGDYTLFPLNIIARVENISTGHIVDDELRRRTKYLSHLPYGCEISFLECDWSNIIDESILQKFDHEINKRRQKKREKIIKEEKDSRKAYFREKEQYKII